MAFSLGAAAVAVATSHQADMNGIRAVQLAKAIRAFRDLDPDHPIKSWIENVGERVYVAVSSGQEAAAGRAADYTRRALLVQHLDAILPDINAENFAGIASDGRDMESLLAGAAIRVSQGKRKGMSNAQAMQAGENWLRMVVSTQIQDAGRAADSVGVATADVRQMTSDEVRQQAVRDGLSDRERLLRQLRDARSTTALSPSRQADVARRKQETLDRIARNRADRQAAKKPPPAKMIDRKRVEIGYIRLLTPPSCARCVILAGRFYRWSDGFKRHPNCFPAGTIVSGPHALAATRRWYEGELVTIRTTGGKELSVTANHPILTERGWIPATFLHEGDRVVSSDRSQGATPLVVPDEKQIPTKIEDLAGPLGMARFSRVPTTPKDFHGDGYDGEVDVVLTDRFLGNRYQSSFPKPDGELALAFRVVASALLSSERLFDEPLTRVLHSAHCVVSRGGLSETFSRSHSGRSSFPGGRTVSDFDTVLQQATADYVSTHSVGGGNDQLAFAGGVSLDYSLNVKGDLSPRWDAPTGPLSVENASGYSSRGLGLSERLAEQVSLDCIVEVTRNRWSGHVYNLTSSEGWFAANGIIASNCDCVHIPAVRDVADDIATDPKQYFNSLSEAEQDRQFGKANAQAIRDGASIGKVVNAQSGMYTADDGKRYTNVGTKKTRRGPRGGPPVLRPTVWQIYKDAQGNRERAKSLLKSYGYTSN
jgi:hypothetical protein